MYYINNTYIVIRNKLLLSTKVDISIITFILLLYKT